MNILLQKQREKLKNTENSLVVSVIEVHLRTIHEWVNNTWGCGICVFCTDAGITTGINPGVQNSKNVEKLKHLAIRHKNNSKIGKQFKNKIPVAPFVLSKRLWRWPGDSKNVTTANTSQALCQLHKDTGKSNGCKLKLDKSKLKVMYHVFIHQSTESLGQYTRKIAGKGAFKKADFCLNLWLDWDCYRGQIDDQKRFSRTAHCSERGREHSRAGAISRMLKFIEASSKILKKPVLI